MAAQLLRFSEHPPTIGGQYESEVVEKLCSKLSSAFTIVANPSFPTRSSFFYEYDLIVFSSFLCEVIEVKILNHYVNVFEDWLEGINGFQIPAVFSKLENKCKVLKDKLDNPRGDLFWRNAPWVSNVVLVGPDSAVIRFKHPPHRDNSKVLKLHDIIRRYSELERRCQPPDRNNPDFHAFRGRLTSYSEKLQSNRKSTYKLGKYFIKRCITQSNTHTEYWANDEPPCRVDVHLKEFPFDPILSQEDTEKYLVEVTRGMQILRGLRHQYIHCVIGHFQTGCSLVQVSDWFDGQSLENRWDSVRGLTLNEKIGLMIQISQGLSYCHAKNVFHRNIVANNILVSHSLDDIRITGFEFAKDFNMSKSLSGSKLILRDQRMIPPEEVLSKGVTIGINVRLYDIYQTGVLFYRIFANGDWPFVNSFDYCMGSEPMRRNHSHDEEVGAAEVANLIYSMLSIKPFDRPDPLSRIENLLNNIYLKT